METGSTCLKNLQKFCAALFLPLTAAVLFLSPFGVIPALGQTSDNDYPSKQPMGTIKGTVVTRDGLPAIAVTISVSDGHSTKSDRDGNFSMEGVKAGRQTVIATFVGLRPKQQEVLVPIDGTVELQIILSEDAQTLQEVIVTGAGEEKILDKSTDYVARMPLSNLENPQVYSVVSKELMKEQVAVDIGEVVRNAPGSVPQVYASGGFGMMIRGFSTGVNARNGMETVSGRSSLDIANIERIEVLKGPSGTLFGSAVSSFGGVVNLVTKKPFETAHTEVSYTTGSYNLNRLTVDVNRPLTDDKSVLFRLNTAVNRQKSFLNYGFNNTFLIAPSLSFRVNERLTFLLDAEYFHTNNTRMVYNRFDRASGITSAEQIPLAYNRVLFKDDGDAKTTVTKFFTEAKYKISKNWTSSTLFSFVGEEVDHSYQFYQTWTAPDSVIRSVLVYGPIYNNYLNVQENVNGQFYTGFLKHNLLIGVNYRYTKGGFNNANTGNIDTVGVYGPVTDVSKRMVDARLVETIFPQASQQTISAYATDVINFTDRFSAMLSLRVDRFERKEIATTPGYKQTALAPKLGLIYQVWKDRLSAFANYMSGFQNLAPSNQPDGTLLVLDPVNANQSEAGVKLETAAKKVSLTLSYYRIVIDNATRINTDGFTVQDGKQVSKGAEFELLANPVPGMHLLAGYVYNDNRIVRASDPTIEGNKAINAPENVANLWVSYTFQHALKGLGLGFGGNYVDKSFGFADNVFSVPSYTVLNATAFYDQPKWRLGFKLNNIGNERYWDAWTAPQAPRNFAVNLTLRF